MNNDYIYNRNPKLDTCYHMWVGVVITAHINHPNVYESNMK